MLTDILVQLRREHYYETIALRGLDEADASELIGEFGSEVPEHVNRKLWEGTKGNPFFLEEMVRHLGSGSADGNGAPWPVELPEGIREVIDRRLATLSDDARDVLTTAAVIGREFSIELLEELGSYDEDKLDEVVDESVARPRDRRGPRRLRALQLHPQPDPPDAVRRPDRHASRPPAPARRRGARAARRRSPRARPPLLPVAADPRRRQGRRVRAAGRAAARRPSSPTRRPRGCTRSRCTRSSSRAPTASSAAGCCSPAATRRPRPASRSPRGRRSATPPTRPARSARPSCSRRRRSATARRARWPAAWSTRPWCG